MKSEKITPQSIQKLMDLFYAKIRKDQNGLGDLFNKKIGTREKDWEHHKAKIGNFWQGMLLGLGDYEGQPLKAHIDLAPFPQEFFALWLHLFEESLYEVFDDKNASMILQRAQMIAQRFQSVLYTH